MSKTLLEIFLSELATLRVQCRSCGVIYEVPLAEVATKLGGTSCKACDADLGIWDSHAGKTALGKLAAVVRDLTAESSRVSVSFVVPEKK